MTPLVVFLLACGAVYLGAIEAAFSALMRLSLRLLAERTGRPDALSDYLDDPLLLFVPVRLLLGVVTAAAAATRRATAAPAPITMACRRSERGSPRATMPITRALSPDMARSISVMARIAWSVSSIATACGTCAR